MDGMYVKTESNRPSGMLVLLGLSLVGNLLLGFLLWQRASAPAPSTPPPPPPKAAAEVPESVVEQHRAAYRELAEELEGCRSEVSRCEAETIQSRADRGSTFGPAPPGTGEETEEPAQDAGDGGVVGAEDRAGLGVAREPTGAFDYAAGMVEVSGEVANAWSGPARGTLVLTVDCGSAGRTTWEEAMELEPLQTEPYRLTLDLPEDAASGCRLTARWQEES
jgi:hypothetical protein